MSFRELRNFCEYMRSLGYPRLISIENFRTPNFELVADVLYWLVHRYEPNASISDDIETESARVEFIKHIAQIFALKARIKLNTRKLYGADGKAVQELLKIVTVLYDAMRAKPKEEEDSETGSTALSNKIADFKATRTLATEITESGLKVYDLLTKEPDLREARDKTLRFLDNISMNLDSNKQQEYIHSCIQSSVASVVESVGQLEETVRSLQVEEQNLDTKIKKKGAELERAEKRLKNIASVRPAFMDEYEKLEKDLEEYYKVYLERFRNLDYLEGELQAYHHSEQEKREEAARKLKRMQKKIKEEELQQLKGDLRMDDDGDEFGDAGFKRPGAARGRGARGDRGVAGSMSGSINGPDDESDEALSEDDEDDEDDEQLNSDDEEDDDDGQISLGDSGSDLIDEDDEDGSDEDVDDGDLDSGSDHEF